MRVWFDDEFLCCVVAVVRLLRNSWTVTKGFVASLPSLHGRCSGIGQVDVSDDYKRRSVCLFFVCCFFRLVSEEDDGVKNLVGFFE